MIDSQFAAFVARRHRGGRRRLRVPVPASVGRAAGREAPAGARPRRAPTGASAIADGQPQGPGRAEPEGARGASRRRRTTLTLETRIAQAGLAWTRTHLHPVQRVAAACSRSRSSSRRRNPVRRRRRRFRRAASASRAGCSTIVRKRRIKSVHPRAAQRRRRHRARHRSGPPPRRLPAHRRQRGARAGEVASSGRSSRLRPSA